MAKVLPKRYFPVHGQAKICLRKVDKWAEIHAKSGISPFFDTWKDAHAYMLADAIKKRDRLVRDLARIDRHLARVQKMLEP